MIDHVPELMDAGLDSLKIEGRAKSAYYAAIVTAAYRHAIDAAQAGEPLDPVWRAEVDKVSHRPYSTGFYYGEPGQHTAHARYLRDWQVVGVVTSLRPPTAPPCVSCATSLPGGTSWSWWAPACAPSPSGWRA